MRVLWVKIWYLKSADTLFIKQKSNSFKIPYSLWFSLVLHCTCDVSTQPELLLASLDEKIVTCSLINLIALNENSSCINCIQLNPSNEGKNMFVYFQFLCIRINLSNHMFCLQFACIIYIRLSPWRLGLKSKIDKKTYIKFLQYCTRTAITCC